MVSWERGRPARRVGACGRGARHPSLLAWGGLIGDGRLVRIRIYGIIGFSGFYCLAFDLQALIRIRIGVISRYGEKRKRGESEILKIPLI